MKIAFFIALLANIILFLWGYFGHDLQTGQVLSNPEPKQIFLVSELSPAQRALLQTSDSNKPAARLDADKTTTGSGLPPSSPTQSQINLLDYHNGLASVFPLLDAFFHGSSKEPDAKIAVTQWTTSAQAPTNTAFILPNKAAPATSNHIPDTRSSTESTSRSPEINSAQDAVEKKEVPAATASLFCYEIGPFKNKNAFIRWQRRSNLPIVSSQTFTKLDRDTGTYMVYVPMAETDEKSQQSLSFLKKQGITDFWMFTEGEDKGNISLGVFQDYERALQFQQELQEKNIATLVKKRLRDRPIQTIFAQINLAEQWPEDASAINLITMKNVERCQQQ